MSLVHFTVSQIRVAAACPRIHYFDAEHTRRNKLAKPHMTRIWKGQGGTAPAGGARFHHVVERFNRMALTSDEVEAAIRTAKSPALLHEAVMRFVNYNCIDLEALAARPVGEKQAFIVALQTYMSELAEVAYAARARGSDAEIVREQLFGDQRRRVDVTFRVGDGQEVHVTGAVDYVFYDARTKSHRIIDYKLTPSSEPNSDLFQVCTYALMHHHQHQTRPDVAVFYLHPERHIVEKKWDDLYADRNKVYDLLASMVSWARYDESARDPKSTAPTGSRTGLLPPGNPAHCGSCKWRGVCETRLGPKHEGAFDRRWEELAASQKNAAPEVQAHVPPTVDSTDDDEDDNDDEDESPLEEAPSSERGLVIGLSGNRRVVVPPSALTTHVAVVGAAGSGKTWMAKVIVEEAIRNGVPVLAVDPQGDLVQFLRGRPDAEGEPRFEQERQEFLRVVEPRVFTPGTSHGIRLSLDPIRVPGPGDLDRITNPDRREEEQRTMLDQVAGNLVGLAKSGGEVDSQRSFVYQVLVALTRMRSANATLTLRDIVAAIQEPEAAGIDEPDRVVKKGDREKLARKLNALVEGPASGLFTGGVRLDMTNLLTPSTPGKVPLNVLYLNALTDDDQKHFFLASLAAEIYRWMVTSLEASSGRPNLLFYLDEARDFIPAGGRKPPAKEPLIRLFTQGRKYGVACLFCTQSPRSVDYNVFGNSSTKIIGRLEAAQDVERVGEWFTTSGAKPAWLADRKGAAPGTFVGRWPGMPPELEGTAITSRKLFSAHEGAWSPDRVEREVDEAGIRPSG